MRLWLFGSDDDRFDPDAEAAARLLAETILLARAYLKAQFKQTDTPSTFRKYGRKK